MIPKVRPAWKRSTGASARSTSSTAAMRHSLLMEVYTSRGVGTEIVKTR